MTRRSPFIQTEWRRVPDNVAIPPYRGGVTEQPEPRAPGDQLSTRVYMHLLRDPSPRRSHLAKEGFSEPEIVAALTTLQARGLVDASRRDAIDVAPPETTLPAYAADLERQARATRSAIEGLAHMYSAARAGDGSTDASREIRLLDTVDDIENAFFRAARGAESRIVRLVARSERMDQVVIRHAESIVAKPTARAGGLERMAVFEQSILEVEGAFAALEAIRADGVDVRLTPHLAFSVLAVDRASAVIDISHLEPQGGGSLFVRQRQLASALMDMCIGLFSLATPLPRSPQGAALGRLSERDGQVLALLAAGASDQTIARQLSISQRTVERRVRAIMEELGATTRFQAGTTAVRRGYL
ncbi:regulatory LuxR family protein [Knoellia remsis]|uniref:Regulatory LuxR family protein n=1 Tax=Knoellia remsis TaxID=407159 RepID=A0A2T0UJU3_9MICO|nr:regulatory LuxR family protein [Knoellia remsis]